MIAEPGEVAGRTQGPIGIVDVQTKLVDPGKTFDILEAAAAAEFAQQFGRIRAMAREEGRDPAHLGSALYHNININEDRAAALAESKAFLDAYYTAKFTPQFVEQWTVAGGPKECAEQLRAYFGAGLGHMALRLASWNQRAQLARFLGEVAPALGDR